jgi:hypothetical protein
LEISGETGLDEAGSGQGFAFGEISIGSTERRFPVEED